MRVLRMIAIMLFTLVACNVDDDYENKVLSDYDKAASLFGTNIDESERLSINSFNLYNKTNNIEGIAKFSYLLGIIYQVKENYTSSIDYLLIANTYFDKTGDKKYAAKTLER